MARTVRFTVMTAFVERQLFQVREASDGSLVLCLANGTWQTGGDVLHTRDVHITAHTAIDHNGTWGNRVKHTALATDNNLYETHIIVTDKKKRGFIWPMTSALNGLASGRPFKKRANDEIVPLIGYLGPEETITYTVYAVDRRINLPQVQGFSYYRVDFKTLSLVVYVSFYHRSNALVEIHRDEGGKALLKNKSPMFPTPYQSRELVAPRMTEHGIERYLQSTNMALAHIFNTAYPPQNDPLPRKSPHPLQFSRWAAINDDIHDDFGVMARTRNPIYDDPHDLSGRLKHPEERYPPAYVAKVQLDSTIFNAIGPAVRAGISPEVAAKVEKLIAKNEAAD